MGCHLHSSIHCSKPKVIMFSPVATALSFPYIYICIFFSSRHFILYMPFLLFQTLLLSTGYICSFKAGFNVIYKHYYEILLVKKKSGMLDYLILSLVVGARAVKY